MYFLFAFEPSTSISFLIDFLISRKINKKKNNKRTMFAPSKYCKFWLLSCIKLLSIKVKKVKKPTNKVIINNIITRIFFLINSIIMQ